MISLAIQLRDRALVGASVRGFAAPLCGCGYVESHAATLKRCHFVVARRGAEPHDVPSTAHRGTAPRYAGRAHRYLCEFGA